MANGDLLWNDQRATLDLAWRGGPRLHGLSAEVHVAGYVLTLPGDEPHCQISADRAAWYLDAPGLQIAWRWQAAPASGTQAPTSDTQADANGWDVWLEVTNTGQRTMHLQALAPLCALACDLGAPAPPVFYQHGWGSWTPTFARHAAGDHYVTPSTANYQVCHQPHYRPGHADEFIGEWVTVLKSPDHSLLVGFVTTANQLASVHWDDPGLTARCWLDKV